MLAYDDIVNGPLATYLTLSAKIGGSVKTHADMVVKAVQAQRDFLVIASQSKAPSQDVLCQLLKPTSDNIQTIQDYREKNRTNEYFNHLSAISESIPALGWVAVAPTPGPYVKEMNDASQFYTNKVLVAYKEKDKTHVEWARAWISFLTELQAFIKVNHTTGLTWNPRGVEVTAGVSQANGSQRGPPLPPPPPPPADFFADGDKGGADIGRQALLQSLNQGTEITKNLKRVTADQQTHKNPALRTSGPTPYKPPVASKPLGRVSPPRGTPKFALEGKKWCVEFQSGKQELTINETEMSQSINIYKCDDITVIVKGKVNSITVDSCKKLALVFDDIVSVVEFINCQRIQTQVNDSTLNQ